jgi:L-amino acid N-acyltransferase YncA
MRPSAIRPATAADAEAIWQIFKAVVAGGDTYAFAPDTPRQAALDYFFGANKQLWVAEEDGVVVGLYKLMPNARDLGSHVANASFMVAPSAHGRGIGRALGEHCLNEARRTGYQAMQFNFVVSTNKGAVHLWQELGFTILATQPKAFKHSTLGYVDAYVMHRFL